MCFLILKFFFLVIAIFPLKTNVTYTRGTHYEIVPISTLAAACNVVSAGGKIPTRFHVNGTEINLNGKAVQICGRVVDVNDMKYHLNGKLESHGSSFNIKVGKYREIVQAVVTGNTVIITGVSLF